MAERRRCDVAPAYRKKASCSGVRPASSSASAAAPARRSRSTISSSAEATAAPVLSGPAPQATHSGNALNSGITLNSARVCPALFGDRSRRARNAAARQQQLDWIDEEPAGVTLVFTEHAWVEPTPMRLEGIMLRRVDGTNAEVD